MTKHRTHYQSRASSNRMLKQRIWNYSSSNAVVTLVIILLLPVSN